MAAKAVAEPEVMTEAEVWQSLEPLVRLRIHDAVVSYRQEERTEYERLADYWRPDEPDLEKILLRGVVDAKRNFAIEICERLSAICSEAWKQKGFEVTPGFRQAVFQNVIFRQIQVERQTGAGIIRRLALRYGTDPDSCLAQIYQDCDNLEVDWRIRLDAELPTTSPTNGQEATGQLAELPTFFTDHPGQKGDQPYFKHSDDFRSVSLQGQHFTFTPNQAKVIEVLYDAWQNGSPVLGQAYILEQLDSLSKRLRDTFKSNMSAWRALIRSPKKGGYCLNLPVGPQTKA